MVPKRIFREYDIRGEMEKELTPEFAYQLGRAFSQALKEKNPAAQRVSVGRDARLSSPELAEQIIKGILDSGVNVIDIGLCPTPLQYFSLYHLDLDGGIMVTGSHNPPEYNGFKLSIGKETIFGKDIQRIREIIEEGKYQYSGKGHLENYDIIRAYKDYIEKELSYLAKEDYPVLKVVIDSGNGTAGLVAPDILRALGCEVVELYSEPDGRFPNHHPDPTVVDYIQDLIVRTKQTGAHIGVGYDGDADRIGVVNRNGQIIWGDQLMIVLSRDILKTHPGAKIIADVKCSDILFDDIKRHGGQPIIWKTGHSLVKEKMRAEKALLAGEFSGHIFIAERYFGYDDAIYTTVRLVEIMKKEKKDITELLSDVPRLYFTPEIRIPCPDEKKKAVVERVVKNFLEYRQNGGSPYRVVDLNTIDGVRVKFEEGWALLRMSNTQPVVVMRVEAISEDAMEAYRDFMENEFKKALEAL
ncbi:MAG: phosphomannomutase/phosphoglucomutase [Nitrospirae bacterium]|nr:phosphomannomutase/phosphoglucomutase [Nitrospirota bacterium]